VAESPGEGILEEGVLEEGVLGEESPGEDVGGILVQEGAWGVPVHLEAAFLGPTRMAAAAPA